MYFGNLTATAHGMLRNFAHILRIHGFIPNSGNIQWEISFKMEQFFVIPLPLPTNRLSRRSQPPLFTQMISDYYDATGNKTFLQEFLPYAERELEWWKQNRSIELELPKEEGGARAGERRHLVFRYKVGRPQH